MTVPTHDGASLSLCAWANSAAACGTRRWARSEIASFRVLEQVFFTALVTGGDARIALVVSERLFFQPPSGGRALEA